MNKLIDELVQRNWAVAPGFVPNGLAEALRADAIRLFDEGSFREARIGRSVDLKTEKKIRSDEISWFEPSQLSPAQSLLWAILEKLREKLNEQLFLGLADFEAHYARYAPGSSYGKHVDRFNSDDARVVSVVIYLNENWTDRDGGQLRLYVENNSAEAISGTVSIRPESGTLVCFLSERLEHEVLPSTDRARLSVAAWFRKRKSPLR